jgi:hypothetical protein
MQILGRMRNSGAPGRIRHAGTTWPIFQSGRSRSAVGAYAGVITCFSLLIANCARIWCFRHVRVPSGALRRCCLDLEPMSWQDPRTDRNPGGVFSGAWKARRVWLRLSWSEHQLSSAARRLSRHSKSMKRLPIRSVVGESSFSL